MTHFDSQPLVLIYQEKESETPQMNHTGELARNRVITY